MGSWGFNILENDASADAYGTYEELMNSGLSPSQALKKIRSEFSEPLADPEDAAYIWLGVAKAQWEYGHIDEQMIRRVESIATSKAHLSEWDDTGPKGREKRRKVVETFAAKLRTKCLRPKKPRKPKLRQPIYEPGACLAIQQPDGKYLAALVTFHVIEKLAPGQDALGINSVALLDYYATKPPTMAVFEKRDYVREEKDDNVAQPWVPVVRTCHANFHRRHSKQLSVIGAVRLTKKDALVPKRLTFWNYDEGPKLINEWHKNRKRRDLLLANWSEEVPAIKKKLAAMEAILRKDNPNRPPRKTLEQRIDLSPLKKNGR